MIGVKMEVDVQYVTDNNGRIQNVILPIDYWRRINCEDETEYLLKSQINRDRLLESLTRNYSLSKEDVYARIGI
jgi:PHD/YefM family antitoxin component YafN of YafNO toxin-antitoxin module